MSQSETFTFWFPGPFHMKYTSVFTRNCTVVLLVSIFEIQPREWYCKPVTSTGLQNSIPFFPKVEAARFTKLTFAHWGNFGRITMQTVKTQDITAKA